MTDGATWVFDNGTLTEMKLAKEEETEEMKQLKAENEELKKQITELQAANDKAITELEKEVVAIKAQVKSDISTFEKSSAPGSREGDEMLVPGKPKIGI